MQLPRLIHLKNTTEWGTFESIIYNGLAGKKKTELQKKKEEKADGAGPGAELKVEVQEEKKGEVEEEDYFFFQGCY